MLTLTYKLLKETITDGQDRKLIEKSKKGYLFSFVREGSLLTYPDNDWKGRSRRKEIIRAFFLVKLVDKYGFEVNDIQLDVEAPEMERAEVVVYKKRRPYIVAECEELGILIDEVERLQKGVIRKAKKLGARYAVLIVGSHQTVFDVLNGPKQIADLPLTRA